MQYARALHFSCIFVDPGDPTNKIVITAGGLNVVKKVDIFLKRKSQSFHDLDTVERFDFSKGVWDIFNAKLSIPRHQASICELKGFLYVIGGHKVELPNEFISSIERCHVKCH